MVTRERWLQAQEAERKYHTEDFQTGFDHYGISYAQYFKHTGVDSDLKGKNICEIGPADFPALAYCKNVGDQSLIIEPMPSEYLKRFGFKIVTELAEDAIYKADEVWLFNVLQHVMDPGKIVENAKASAKIIRFFEPINYGTNEAHPWNLTLEMFQNWFKKVNYYPFNENAVKFHTWECAYGTWEKQ
jgi:hypothetical protein